MASTEQGLAPNASSESVEAATSTKNPGEAIVVSFGAGKQYYYDAADLLESRLDELGVDHDVVRMDIPEGQDWIDICKQKIRFFRDMLRKHERPILWIDVDTVILQRPDALLQSNADLTAFLRSFKSFVGFDPEQHSRLFAPSYITFGYNERVLKFLDFAVELVEKSDVRATDDYFLQEALAQGGSELRFMLMSPADVAKTTESDSVSSAYFVHGHSGNVTVYKGQAEQHDIAALALPRQKKVLLEAVRTSLRKGDREAAGFFYNRIRRLDPADPDTLSKYLEFLRKTQQWKKLEYHVDRSLKDEALRPVAERVSFLAALDKKEWQLADRQYEKATATGSPNAALMKSRLVRFDLDRRAEDMGISDDERVKMWWMESPYPGNFGDIINPYVIEGLTGIPPKFTHNANRLLAIGSIIKFAKKGSTVWGAGSPSRDQPLSPDAAYHAVRGPLTRELVLANGGHVDEVYGDAAWFLPKIFRPEVKKTHKLGIILHVVHEVDAPPIDPDVKIIDLKRVGRGEIEDFIRELLSCESVLSTSLHGVIMAHAYGIPVRWCVATGSAKQIHGDGMKFEDYFLSVGRHAPEPLDISLLDRISTDLADKCQDNPSIDIDLKKLASVAPFKVNLEL